MTTKIVVKIEGLRELGIAFKELTAEVQLKAAKEATAAGIRVVRNRARQLAPERTGLLKSTIGARRLKKDSYPGMEWWFVSVKAASSKNKGGPKDPYYWRFVEFGTVNMPAQPFLFPAFDKEMGAGTNSPAVRILAQTLRMRIETIRLTKWLGGLS